MTRLLAVTDGLVHPRGAGVDIHHAAPVLVGISNTTTSIPPGSTANIDTALPRADFVLARIIVRGPKSAVGTDPLSAGYEGAYVQATTVAAQAYGCSARDAGAFHQYGGHWAKSLGALVLSEYVFDSNTSPTANYIAIQDAVIIGAVLRLTMKNSFGGSATVYVKGSALLF